MNSFNDIICREPAKEHLKNALAGGRFSHAYIITGPAGSGKNTLAGLAAKTLLCENGGREPCGVCLSCRSFDSSNHPDVIRIRPDKKKTISTDYIREAVVSDAAVKPYRSRYKVYIIEKADQMLPASQNILLKTLEEPPSHGIFLLCAQTLSLLLPTVLSRCVTLRIIAPPVSETAKFLRGRLAGISEGEAWFYSAVAGGSAGLALELSSPDKSGIPRVYAMREVMLSVFEGISKKSPADILLSIKAFEEYRDGAALLLDLAAAWYRDTALCVECGRAAFGRLMFRDIEHRVLAEAERLSGTNTPEMLPLIEKARIHLSANVSYLPAMEVLALSAWKLAKGTDRRGVTHRTMEI